MHLADDEKEIFKTMNNGKNAIRERRRGGVANANAPSIAMRRRGS